MSGVIAEAAVRIRPDMSGFRAETEAGVKSAFAGIGKVVGAALAVGGAVDLGKRLVEAATEHQAAFAVLETTLSNAGAANELYGQTVEGLLEREGRLKGFSDEELAQAFIRLVSVTHDTGRAFKDLQEVEDVSRARHLGLAQSALQVSKAEQGSVQSLARIGIIVPAVTKAVDDLRHRHDEAAASGAKFTQQQKEQYQAALAAAAVADKQARAEVALQLIQQRFGGSAGRFADTAAGQFARLGQDVHQFAVAVGEEALPALAGGAETIGAWVSRLKESGDVQDATSSGLHTLAGAYHDVETVVETIGPPLARIAADVAKVASAIGAGPLLTGVATFKALGLAVGVVSLAEREWAKIVALGASEQTAATRATAGRTAATAASTAALRANTAAEVANAASAGTMTISLAAAGTNTRTFAAATERSTSTIVRTGAAAEQSAGKLAILGRGLIALATSPTGLIIGLAAAAAGIVYLATRESVLSRANRDLSASTRDLKRALDELPTERIAVEQARLDVATARAALSQSKAARATIEHRRLALDLRSALDELRQAEERLGETSGTRAAALAAQASAISAVADAARRVTVIGVRAPQDLGLLADRAAKFAQQIRRIADENRDLTPTFRHNLGLLAQYATRIGQAPNSVETRVVLDNTDAKASLDELLAKIRGSVADFSLAGDAAGRGYFSSLDAALHAGLPGLQSFFEGLAGAARGAIVTPNATAAVQNAVDATLREVAVDRQKIVDSVYQAHADTIAQLKQELADAVQSGTDAVRAAVLQAQQNLVSLGATLADQIAQLVDAGPLGERIKRLQGVLDARQLRDQRTSLRKAVADARKELAQKEAALPAGPFTRRQQTDIDVFLKPQRDALAAAKKAERDFESQQTISRLGKRQQHEKDAAKSRISDLTAAADLGIISPAQFERSIAALLSREGVSVKTAGARLGLGFRAGFEAELKGLRAQVEALSSGPRIPGAGLGPQIVRPLDAIKQSQKEIERVRSSQHKETNKILREIHGQVAASKFSKSLRATGAKKNADDAADLAGVTP